MPDPVSGFLIFYRGTVHNALLYSFLFLATQILNHPFDVWNAAAGISKRIPRGKRLRV